MNWLVSFTILLCLCTATFAQTMPPAANLIGANPGIELGAHGAQAPEFLFGAEWPFQPSQALRDRFYEAGFNMTRLNGGGYGWAVAEHEKDVADLEQHGCKVILQLASHYPSADYFKFTDSYLIDSDGGTGNATRSGDWAVNYPGGAWPQYSYADADVKARMEVDFAGYLGALKGHGNIDSIILHNEPGYFWVNRVYDYNPQAIAAFRAWLPTQYPSVATLNAVWGTSYAAFDVVDPPQAKPPVPNIASWLDWRRFHIELIEAFLSWEAGVAKTNWPGVQVTTNIGGPFDHWFPYRLGDNYRYTEPMAIAGIDCYPGSAWTDRFYTGFTMDQMNGAALGFNPRRPTIPLTPGTGVLAYSVNETPSGTTGRPSAPQVVKRPVYVLECEVYSPQKFPYLTDEQRAALVSSEVWGFIGHGAKAVCLWGLGGMGDANLTDGEWNSRLAACRDIAYQAKMLHLGEFERRPSRVAVVVDQDTLLYYGGLEPTPGSETATIAQDAQGLYAAAVASGAQTDVISESQFVNGGFRRYATVLLSSQAMIDDQLTGVLTQFVRGGGTLVADAPLAIANRHGGPVATSRVFIPAFGDTFGPCKPGGADITTGKVTLPGSFCREDVDPITSVALGHFADGKPALTDNRDGAGHALFFATLVGNVGGDDWAHWSGRALSSVLGGVIHEDTADAMSRLQSGAASYVDRGVLSDDRGNVLLCLNIPQQKDTPLNTIPNYAGSVSDLGRVGPRHAYLFQPTTVQDGGVRSGPAPLPIDTAGRFQIDKLDAAAQILLARDACPLLALSTASSVAAGSPVTVAVTIFNPSPRAISGVVSLVAPGGGPQTGPSPTVTIPAWGNATLALTCSAPSAPGRLVVTASFTPTLGSDRSPVSAIPVDVDVR